MIARLHRKLKKSRKPAVLVNRGYARFLEFPADGRIRINLHKVDEAARWDGLRALIANGNEHLQARQLLAQYRQLWQIEHGFRTNKHDLRIRPIYHWTPRRIRAHIAICYMAFCCVQHLCHRLQALGHPMSVESMRRQLNALQFSVLVQSATD